MKKIFEFFGSKNFKFNTVALVMMIVVIVIVIFVNMIGEQLNVIFDMTDDKMFSIGSQTKTILSRLENDVDVIFLADENRIKSASETGFWVWNILEKYGEYPKVNVRYVDPDLNPGIITELDPDESLSIRKENIIVRSEGRIRRLTVSDVAMRGTGGTINFLGEQAITSAIINVTTGKMPVVYFLEGQRQRDLNDEYRILRSVLESNNFLVRRVNLALDGQIPDDAEILFVAAPKTDLSASDRDKLEDYLLGGGNAIFLFDSMSTDRRLTNFEYLLAKYDLSLNYDRIKETHPSRHLAERPYDILPDLIESQIFSELNLSDFNLPMPESRSIKLLRNDPEGVNVVPLLTASMHAQREPLGTVESEEDLTGGPIDIAVAVEYDGEENSKILVIGNGYFLTDMSIEEYYPLSQNGIAFIMSMIGWMYQESSDVFIMPKTNFYDTVTVSGSSARIILIFVIFGVPLFIMVLGITIWLRRRHL
ncbi:UNVERIFIED_CONTAM: ABC-type uncharacterized transport system involved in gliding motility auxiliary subunit [Acetivibrio alkalicellulosi]